MMPFIQRQVVAPPRCLRWLNPLSRQPRADQRPPSRAARTMLRSMSRTVPSGDSAALQAGRHPDRYAR